jgi:hypothetical protein
MKLSSISIACAADMWVSETIITPIFCSPIILWILCHLWLSCEREVAVTPFMLIAFTLMLALVFRLILGLPICWLSLFLVKNAGACSSSWGQPRGGRRFLGCAAPFWRFAFAPAVGATGLGPVAVLLASLPAALRFPLCSSGSAKRRAFPYPSPTCLGRP